jgi:phosphopantetheine binding protein
MTRANAGVGATTVDVVLAVFAEVLGSSPEPDVSFFDAGGDSLLAMAAVAQIAERMGVALKPRQFMADASAAGVAGEVDRLVRG